MAEQHIHLHDIPTSILNYIQQQTKSCNFQIQEKNDQNLCQKFNSSRINNPPRHPSPIKHHYTAQSSSFVIVPPIIADILQYYRTFLEFLNTILTSICFEQRIFTDFPSYLYKHHRAEYRLRYSDILPTRLNEELKGLIGGVYLGNEEEKKLEMLFEKADLTFQQKWGGNNSDGRYTSPTTRLSNIHIDTVDIMVNDEPLYQMVCDVIQNVEKLFNFDTNFDPKNEKKTLQNYLEKELLTTVSLNFLISQPSQYIPTSKLDSIIPGDLIYMLFPSFEFDSGCAEIDPNEQKFPHNSEPFSTTQNLKNTQPCLDNIYTLNDLVNYYLYPPLKPSDVLIEQQQNYFSQNENFPQDSANCCHMFSQQHSIYTELYPYSHGYINLTSPMQHVSTPISISKVGIKSKKGTNKFTNNQHNNQNNREKNNANCAHQLKKTLPSFQAHNRSFQPTPLNILFPFSFPQYDNGIIHNSPVPIPSKQPSKISLNLLPQQNDIDSNQNKHNENKSTNFSHNLPQFSLSRLFKTIPCLEFPLAMTVTRVPTQSPSRGPQILTLTADVPLILIIFWFQEKLIQFEQNQIDNFFCPIKKILFFFPNLSQFFSSQSNHTRRVLPDSKLPQPFALYSTQYNNTVTNRSLNSLYNFSLHFHKHLFSLYLHHSENNKINFFSQNNSSNSIQTQPQFPASDLFESNAYDGFNLISFTSTLPTTLQKTLNISLNQIFSPKSSPFFSKIDQIQFLSQNLHHFLLFFYFNNPHYLFHPQHEDLLTLLLNHTKTSPTHHTPYKLTQKQIPPPLTPTMSIYPKIIPPFLEQYFEFFGLNFSQKIVLLNALCLSFSCLQGPPGTGKTHTIGHLIALYLIFNTVPNRGRYGGSNDVFQNNKNNQNNQNNENNKNNKNNHQINPQNTTDLQPRRVLLTGHSHSSVDQMMLKTISNINHQKKKKKKEGQNIGNFPDRDNAQNNTQNFWDSIGIPSLSIPPLDSVTDGDLNNESVLDGNSIRVTIVRIGLNEKELDKLQAKRTESLIKNEKNKKNEEKIAFYKHQFSLDNHIRNNVNLNPYATICTILYIAAKSIRIFQYIDRFGINFNILQKIDQNLNQNNLNQNSDPQIFIPNTILFEMIDGLNHLLYTSRIFGQLFNNTIGNAHGGNSNDINLIQNLNIDGNFGKKNNNFDQNDNPKNGSKYITFYDVMKVTKSYHIEHLQYELLIKQNEFPDISELNFLNKKNQIQIIFSQYFAQFFITICIIFKTISNYQLPPSILNPHIITLFSTFTTFALTITQSIQSTLPINISLKSPTNPQFPTPSSRPLYSISINITNFASYLPRLGLGKVNFIVIVLGRFFVNISTVIVLRHADVVCGTLASIGRLFLPGEVINGEDMVGLVNGGENNGPNNGHNNKNGLQNEKNGQLLSNLDLQVSKALLDYLIRKDDEANNQNNHDNFSKNSDNLDNFNDIGNKNDNKYYNRNYTNPKLNVDLDIPPEKAYYGEFVNNEFFEEGFSDFSEFSEFSDFSEFSNLEKNSNNLSNHSLEQITRLGIETMTDDDELLELFQQIDDIYYQNQDKNDVIQNDIFFGQNLGQNLSQKIQNFEKINNLQSVKPIITFSLVLMDEASQTPTSMFSLPMSVIAPGVAISPYDFYSKKNDNFVQNNFSNFQNSTNLFNQYSVFNPINAMVSIPPKFILVGDTNQLPPTVVNPCLDFVSYDKSILQVVSEKNSKNFRNFDNFQNNISTNFEQNKPSQSQPESHLRDPYEDLFYPTLYEPTVPIQTLNIHYRMHPGIGKLISSFFYQNNLKSPHEFINLKIFDQQIDQQFDQNNFIKLIKSYPITPVPITLLPLSSSSSFSTHRFEFDQQNQQNREKQPQKNTFSPHISNTMLPPYMTSSTLPIQLLHHTHQQSSAKQLEGGIGDDYNVNLVNSFSLCNKKEAFFITNSILLSISSSLFSTILISITMIEVIVEVFNDFVYQLRSDPVQAANLWNFIQQNDKNNKNRQKNQNNSTNSSFFLNGLTNFQHLSQFFSHLEASILPVLLSFKESLSQYQLKTQEMRVDASKRNHTHAFAQNNSNIRNFAQNNSNITLKTPPSLPSSDQWMTSRTRRRLIEAANAERDGITGGGDGGLEKPNNWSKLDQHHFKSIDHIYSVFRSQLNDYMIFFSIDIDQNYYFGDCFEQQNTPNLFSYFFTLEHTIQTLIKVNEFVHSEYMLSPSDISVISMYSAQVPVINNYLKELEIELIKTKNHFSSQNSTKNPSQNFIQDFEIYFQQFISFFCAHFDRLSGKQKEYDIYTQYIYSLRHITCIFDSMLSVLIGNYHNFDDKNNPNNFNHIFDLFFSRTNSFPDQFYTLTSNISVMTVDASQGTENGLLLLSTVRNPGQLCYKSAVKSAKFEKNRKNDQKISKRTTNPSPIPSLGFLNDYRRVNVALSRAKRGVIIFGNAFFLSQNISQKLEKPTIKNEKTVLNQIGRIFNFLNPPRQSHHNPFHLPSFANQAPSVFFNQLSQLYSWYDALKNDSQSAKNGPKSTKYSLVRLFDTRARLSGNFWARLVLILLEFGNILNAEDFF